MPENKHLRRGLKLVYLALGVLAVWLLFKYALPWLMPFIIAFAISRLIEPLVRLLTTRLKFKRAIASALCTVLVFLALIALTAAIIWRIIYELTALTRDLPALLTDISSFISAMRDRINVYITNAPFEMQDYFQNALDAFTNTGTDLLGAATGWLLSLITSAASFSPRIAIFIFTCAVSTYFISSGYRDVSAFIMRQLPENQHKAVREFRIGLVKVFGKWFKAEAMLSGAAFIQLLIAFLILRIPFAIVLALIIAIIDLIPLIGVGSILVPWATISLIAGNFARAITLVITFGVIAIVRNILEPKLVGSQIGLPPITTLLAMYIGFSTIGVFGLALFPIGLVVLKQLNDREYIHLWK